MSSNNKPDSVSTNNQMRDALPKETARDVGFREEAPKQTWNAFILVCLAYLVLVLHKLATLPVIGIVYVALVSEGLRSLIPTFGQRLYRQPGLSFLRDYEGWHKFDLAHVMACILLVAVFSSWCINLRLWFAPHEFVARTGWRLEAYRLVATVLSWAVLICDACLFYAAMSQGESIWDAAKTISWSAILATLLYCAIIVFLSFSYVTLEKKVGL